MDEEEAKRQAAASASAPPDSGASSGSSAPLEAPSDTGSSAPADTGSSAPLQAPADSGSSLSSDSGSSPSQQSGDSSPSPDQYSPPAVQSSNEETRPPAPPKNDDINQNPAEALTGDAGYQAPNVSGSGGGQDESQAPKDTTGTQAYLQGADAMPPQYSNLIDQKVDPDGTMSPSERVIKGINYAAQNYGMDAASDKLAHHQQMFQHYTHGLGATAAEHGDWAKAAHYATQGYKHVPDGLDVAFEPTSTGAIAKIAPDDPHLQPTSLMLNGAEFGHYLKHGTFDHIMMQGIGQTLDNSRQAGQQYAANDTGTRSDASGGSAEPVDTGFVPQRENQDTTQPIVPPKPEDTNKALAAANQPLPETPAVGDTSQYSPPVSDKAAPPRDARPWDDPEYASKQTDRHARNLMEQDSAMDRIQTATPDETTRYVQTGEFNPGDKPSRGAGEGSERLQARSSKDGEHNDITRQDEFSPPSRAGAGDNRATPALGPSDQDIRNAKVHPDGTYEFSPEAAARMRKEGYTDRALNTWETPEAVKSREARDGLPMVDTIRGGPHPSSERSYKQSDGSWKSTPDPNARYAPPPQRGGITMSGGQAEYEPPASAHQKKVNGEWVDTPEQKYDHQTPQEGGGRDVARVKSPSISDDDIKNVNKFNDKTNQKNKLSPAENDREIALEKKYGWELGDWDHPRGTSRQNPGGDKNAPAPGPDPKMNKKLASEGDKPLSQPMPGQKPPVAASQAAGWLSDTAKSLWNALPGGGDKPPVNGKTGQPIPEGEPVKQSRTQLTPNDQNAFKKVQEQFPGDLAKQKRAWSQYEKDGSPTWDTMMGSPKVNAPRLGDPDRTKYYNDKLGLEQQKFGQGQKNLDRQFEYGKQRDALHSADSRYASDSHVKSAQTSASGHVQAAALSANAHVRGSQLSAQAHRDAAAMHAEASQNAARMAAKAKRAAAIWEFYAKQNQAKAAIRAAKAHANAMAQASMNHPKHRGG